MQVKNSEIEDYVTMIPYHNDEKHRDNGYAFIAKSWKYMNENIDIIDYYHQINYRKNCR